LYSVMLIGGIVKHASSGDAWNLERGMRGPMPTPCLRDLAA
jgi:hypothetical protein